MCWYFWRDLYTANFNQEPQAIKYEWNKVEYWHHLGDQSLYFEFVRSCSILETLDPEENPRAKQYKNDGYSVSEKARQIQI